MKTINLTIIIGLIFFILGIGLGFMIWFREKPQENIQDLLTEKERAVQMFIDHGTLDNFCANITGEIIEIKENSLIIARNQDRVEVKVEPNIHITRWALPEQPGVVPLSETIQFNQIVVGDNANIYLIITEEGEIWARGISVRTTN